MNKIVKLKKIVKKYQVQGYLVGGVIRDILLDRQFNDIDVVINKQIKEVASQFAKQTNSSLVVLDKKREIYRVVMDEFNYDFAPLQGSSINEDLTSRDFTINALAVPLSKVCLKNGKIAFLNKALIDLFKGEKDLKEGIIRVVNDEAFATDPLRLIRAVRFKARLDFAITRSTEKLMGQVEDRINQIANERIKAELIKILECNNAAFNIVYLEDKFSFFSKVFPIVKELKQINQSKDYCEDRWSHNICAIEKLEQLWNNDKFWDERIEVKWLPRLKFTLLFCGIEDLLNKEIITQLPSILKEFTFSNQEVSYIVRLIKYRLKAINFLHTDNLKFKKKYYFFKEVSSLTTDVCLLALADIISNQRLNDNDKEVKDSLIFFKELVREGENLQKKTAKRLLTGKDIIRLFSISEGPKVGELLKKVELNQAAGKISTKEEAIKYIKNELSAF
ncbi:tRNA nucleotidyltransferase/poly(A) polymerase [Halobacteroides halobius DSM 5150]|uniref:tRNA nucleotidyltransferase/poly(A) polymerase n=1 Tax=Halobacteroides halobius (strain ATCC 35273 / DSM 5150 / MD-1) TaxID=748449 RepID=L0KC40_HALHC|nr:tRNA nucleotidyltransferase/poly(A) polymerase [Halobacteroides halobius]AGB41934.1 tRNA nucleotidyltransferase/poly(A) polymerase [Halobacteroides halobius DSM 5150]